MPPLADADYAALKADIAERGVLVPVEIDEHGNTLDGHHRLRACEELGIQDWPRLVRAGLTEVEKRQHARQLNFARRHLNQAQKRELIAAQLKDTPEKSNRQIAAGLGVDDKTVGAVRSGLESIAEIPQSSRQTKDGRTYPAERKPIRTTYVDTSQPVATMPALLQSVRAATAADDYVADRVEAGAAPTAAGLRSAIREAVNGPTPPATKSTPAKRDPVFGEWLEFTDAIEQVVQIKRDRLKELAAMTRKDGSLPRIRRQVHAAIQLLTRWHDLLKKEIERG